MVELSMSPVRWVRRVDSFVSVYPLRGRSAPHTDLSIHSSDENAAGLPAFFEAA